MTLPTNPQTGRPFKSPRAYHRHMARISQADLTEEVRDRIIRRQGGVCFYCDKPIQGHKYVLDHVIPRHAGGSHGPENRVAAHPPCDGAKEGRMPTEAELWKLRSQLWGCRIRDITLKPEHWNSGASLGLQHPYIGGEIHGAYLIWNRHNGKVVEVRQLPCWDRNTRLHAWNGMHWGSVSPEVLIEMDLEG